MKSLVTGAWVVATAGVLVSVPGLASADGDPVKGLTYAAAASAVANSLPPVQIVVATTVGSVLKQDDCIITHSQSRLKYGRGQRAIGTVLTVNLDCNDALALNGAPGGSAASPAGTVEKQKQATLDYINANPAACDVSAEAHKNCVQFCTDVEAGKCTFSLN